MTDKELRRLKKAQLLEIMIEQEKEISSLKARLAADAEFQTGSRPEASQLEAELSRERYKIRYLKTLRSTIAILIVVAAIAVLIVTLMLPGLRIYGSSMSPTLKDGNVVISVKGSDFQRGDIVAFYYNNKILVKRVIALPGEWVDIDEDGTVAVNNERLEEPYLTEKALGECDITLPYQVPDGRIFVMGDHRSVSVDSRSTVVGCVSEEQIVGRLILRIWPLSGIGRVQ